MPALIAIVLRLILFIPYAQSLGHMWSREDGLWWRSLLQGFVSPLRDTTVCRTVADNKFIDTLSQRNQRKCTGSQKDRHAHCDKSVTLIRTWTVVAVGMLVCGRHALTAVIPPYPQLTRTSGKGPCLLSFPLTGRTDNLLLIYDCYASWHDELFQCIQSSQF